MIAVLGGLGFLGSNLAEELVKQGEEVCLMTWTMDKQRNIAKFKDRVKVVMGDVTDAPWLHGWIVGNKPRLIYHFAGQLTSYESFDFPRYDLDVNAGSTLTILEAMREVKEPCRLVLGSTVWVVGRPDKLPVNEDTPCRPLNLYAAHRLTSEHYCRIYHKVYDVDAVVMRLSNTYGIREQYANKQKAALNHLLYLGYKGEEVPIYSNGQVMRDYVYVSDVVEAAQVIAEKGEPGECYFVGTGVGTWFRDIAEWIGKLTPGRIKFIDPTDFHNRIDIGDIVVDSSKLRKLGWEPTVSVWEGLVKTLEYYQEEGL
jgi:UDP-glucose 4-epimerase